MVIAENTFYLKEVPVYASYDVRGHKEQTHINDNPNSTTEGHKFIGSLKLTKYITLERWDLVTNTANLLFLREKKRNYLYT